MDGLRFFEEELTSQASPPIEPDPMVLTLRNRIHAHNAADSLDVRVALLAELVFLTYIHHLNQLQRQRQ